MFSSKGTDDGRQQDVLTNRATCDAEAKAGMESADTFTRCIDGIQNRLSILAECVPCVRQADVLASPLKELCTENFLQRFDLEGQRRLTDVKSASRLSIVKQVGKDNKALELPDSKVQGSTSLAQGLVR